MESDFLKPPGDLWPQKEEQDNTRKVSYERLTNESVLKQITPWLCAGGFEEDPELEIFASFLRNGHSKDLSSMISKSI